MADKKKNKGDSLGDRMKGYESVPKTNLMRRQPVVIRLDGRAFHTFVKKIRKLDPSYGPTPFCDAMHECMTYTTEQLMKQIQGCVFAYTQSDEISLLIRDYDTLETDSWFGSGVQKTVSVSAAIASSAFNYYLHHEANIMPAPGGQINQADYAVFDSRVFNLPKDEVVNYFLWRQQDASRNSVQMYGHHFFSQKEMHGKNNSQVQDMLMLEKGVNWNDVPTWAKRGTCVIRNVVPHLMSTMMMPYERDEEIPVFSQDRNYVGKHVLTPAQQVEEAQLNTLLLEI